MEEAPSLQDGINNVPKDSLLFLKDKPDSLIPSAFNVHMVYASEDIVSHPLTKPLSVYSISGTKDIDPRCIIGVIAPNNKKCGMVYHASEYIPYNPNPRAYRSYADTR